MPAALPVLALALHAVEGIAWVNALAQTLTIASVLQGVSAVQKQNSEKKQQGGLIDLQLNSSAPRQLIIGKRMTGGVLVDWYLGGSNNTKLYLPVYLSEGPCGQIKNVYAGGRLVWSTPLVHGVRTTIPDFRSGGDRLWLTYYDGRVGQSADSTLVGLGQGWTSANKMTGCAWVLVECQWDSDNMRSPPSLTFEMEGAKLYDRRKDTTAGGSGSHRLNDPSTWEWSDNPAVALDHFLLGRQWNGAKTFGIGLSADEVPYDRFAAQANVCDEDVDLKAGGTQKRYRANGFIFASDDYATTVTKLCTAMAARPADFGGRFGVVGIESRTPVLTIDDGDVIADAPETYTPKRSWAELVTAVEGRYQDPAQLYQPVDYPRVTDGDWTTEDGGEQKVATFDLEFEIDVERAQRLATLKARAERRQAVLKGIYPLWTIELERGDWFIRTGAKWGEDGKTFEVLERILNPDTYTVSIVAQEVDADDSAWDESTAQDGPPAPIASTDTLSDVEVPAITVSAITLTGTAASIPALKVVWDEPTDPRVRFVYIEVENVDGVTPKTVKTILLPADVDETIFQDGIVDGDSYAISAKFLTDTIPSAWCVAEIQAASGTYAVGTAASVPWSGVTGSGRPADNATVGARAGTNLYRTDGSTVMTQAEVRTAEGTAAAITGQGWGATAGQSAADNNYVPAVGLNILRNSRIASVTTGWAVVTNDTGLPATLAVYTDSNGEGYLWLPATGTPAAGKVLYIGNAYNTTNPIRVTGGLRYEYGADVYHLNGGGATGQCICVWLDNSYSYISQSEGVSFSLGGTWNRSTGFATAPSNARYAILVARIITGTSIADPYVGMRRPFMAIASAGQVTASPYSPGPENEIGADVTLTNTAAAITSQGGQATANASYQSSAPSSPNNGDWWYDTTNQILKFRASGAWQNVANFKTTITASASPSSINEVHTGSSFSSGTITITPAGGTSYTYAVTFVKSGGAGNVTLSATNSASFTATASLSSGQDVAGGIIVDVFDSSGASCSIRIPLNFSRTD